MKNTDTSPKSSSTWLDGFGEVVTMFFYEIAVGSFYAGEVGRAIVTHEKKFTEEEFKKIVDAALSAAVRYFLDAAKLLAKADEEPAPVNTLRGAPFSSDEHGDIHAVPDNLIELIVKMLVHQGFEQLKPESSWGIMYDKVVERLPVELAAELGKLC